MTRQNCLPTATVVLAVFLVPGPPSRASDDPPTVVLQTNAEDSVTSVAVSPDGSMIASGGGDGRIRLYDAATGTLLRAIDAEGCRGLRSVAFSPDGTTIVGGGIEMNKTVKVWDVASGAVVKELVGHDAADPGNLYAEVYAVAVAPGGDLVASAGREGRVLVWDLATGELKHRLTGHQGSAVSVAFAPDGRTLVSGGEDKVIRVWDAVTGAMLSELSGHTDAVVTLAFSPDGALLAAGSCDWTYHRGRDTARFEGGDRAYQSQWILWDTATGQPTRTATEPGRVLSLSFAPDGTSLACGAGRELRLYDLRSRSAGTVAARHAGTITSTAFSPDGESLVSGSHDRSLQRTAVKTGQVIWRVPGYWEQVNSVAISPDGALIATGSSDIRFAEREMDASAQDLGPGGVRLWDARTGRLVRRLAGPAEQVMSVAFSPDGQRIAAGGAGPHAKGTVRVWHSRTGEPLWSHTGHTSEVLAVDFSSDAAVASAWADGTVRLHSPGSGAVVRRLEGHDGGATSLAFSAVDNVLACGAGDGTVHLWNTRSGDRIRKLVPPAVAAQATANERPITSVAFSADGNTVAACSSSLGYGDRAVRLWDIRTGHLQKEFSSPQNRGRLVAFSPDGRTLAMSWIGKSIALVDVESGELLRTFAGHAHPPQSAAFSPDGRRLISGGDYRTTKVWDVATARHLATLVTFSEGDPGTSKDVWLSQTADGFYDGSRGIDRYLAWRIGAAVMTSETMSPQLHRPERLAAALND